MESLKSIKKKLTQTLFYYLSQEIIQSMHDKF